MLFTGTAGAWDRTITCLSWPHRRWNVYLLCPLDREFQWIPRVSVTDMPRWEAQQNPQKVSWNTASHPTPELQIQRVWDKTRRPACQLPGSQVWAMLPSRDHSWGSIVDGPQNREKKSSIRKRKLRSTVKSNWVTERKALRCPTALQMYKKGNKKNLHGFRNLLWENMNIHGKYLLLYFSIPQGEDRQTSNGFVA